MYNKILQLPSFTESVRNWRHCSDGTQESENIIWNKYYFQRQLKFYRKNLILSDFATKIQFSYFQSFNFYLRADILLMPRGQTRW